MHPACKGSRKKNWMCKEAWCSDWRTNYLVYNVVFVGVEWLCREVWCSDWRTNHLVYNVVFVGVEWMCREAWCSDWRSIYLVYNVVFVGVEWLCREAWCSDWRRRTNYLVYNVPRKFIKLRDLSFKSFLSPFYLSLINKTSPDFT